VAGLYAHRYIRAYLAGVALPTLVVCAAGLLIVGFFDRLDISVQRALIVPSRRIRSFGESGTLPGSPWATRGAH
jgi:hypothetical protein